MINDPSGLDEFHPDTTLNPGHGQRRAYVEIIEDAPISPGEWTALYHAREPEKQPAYLHYVDSFQPFRWHAKGMNGEIIASGEAYKDKRDCLDAISLLFGQGTEVTLKGGIDVVLRAGGK